jgi:Fe-Mn family superoxide dismutase
MTMSRRTSLHLLALGAGALAALPRFGPLAAGESAAQGAPASAPPPGPAGPYVLPPLGYPYDALEPYLDAQTMQIHHGKHHATYVAKLNDAVARYPDLQRLSVEQLLAGLERVPAEVRAAVRNHGGGHHNHSLLWPTLKKDGARAASGELARAIARTFGGFDGFREKFAAAANAVFGSGWAWLVADRRGAVSIVITANQDSPLSLGQQPLLGIDVWEHAYYLKYQNRRAEYVTAFANVVDWDVVTARHQRVIGG